MLTGNSQTLNPIVQPATDSSQAPAQASAKGSNHVMANAMKGAMNAVNATSKTFQAMAGEMFAMARETVDHATRTLDLLRSTPIMDEIVAIQTDYVKDFFVYALHHTRRLHELCLSYLREINKSYQEAWFNATNAAVATTITARQEIGSNIKIYSEAARKSPSAFENRDSA